MALSASYGKLREFADRSPSKRALIFVLAVASVVVLLSILTCVGVEVGQSMSKKGGNGVDKVFRTSLKADIPSVCSRAPYPDVCVSALSADPGASQASSLSLVGIAIKAIVVEVEKTFSLASTIAGQVTGQLEQTAVDDCLELLDITVEELNSISDMSSFSSKAQTSENGNAHTWLSASLTNQDTCMDGLESAAGMSKNMLAGNLQLVSKLLSNILAIVKGIADAEDGNGDLNVPDLHNRRLLSAQNEADLRDEPASRFDSVDNDFPPWLSDGDRRLLQASGSNVQPDLVVSKDGTGDYTTITDAVNAAPDKSSSRFVIRVKAGVYQENVEIRKNKTNLMFIGDGMDATVVTGSKNFIDGTTTFRSATFAAVGSGFIARDMTFENTAGPSKHQAVALRVGSDLSVLYRCSFKGYQDTLYVHSLRQFYRECEIYGTVDFIFGNAAVVFQRCTLLARRGLGNQKNCITAQGRKDPNQNTGISIHNCNVTAAPDLVPFKNSTQTYLGRPWKEYSRTVFMQSYLDDLISPQGWLEWSGDFALDTLYYGEYMNSGPGAGVADRVTWPGYVVINSTDEASKFTVAQFIDGNEWLPSTGVTYLAGLAL